jgi:hypothetical protein
VLDGHDNSNKENPRNREPGCIYTIEYANSESSSPFFHNPSRETVVYCQSRLRYCYKATVRRSNEQGRSTASHAGKAIYPRLAGFAVGQHEAVAVPAGRDAFAIADVHALDTKCRFGRSQKFTMTPALEVNDVADGQKRVSGVFDFDPGP